uniref:NADH dehydrogenase subunit 2 n=1 Tax=Urolabida histrionica TaxID=2880905 RepID=UPI001D108B42|nr:NADH dehydrogenase subunit 2 [Urolabida histrionica]UCC46130.1 NADH dehydrogenase subunit 2 [Urolabida histrionica]
MKKTNIVLMMVMIMGTMITLMSSNWLSMWMGMEMNMMSFIPLMNLKPSKTSPEASLIYFSVQSMSSIMMLSMVMMTMMEQMYNIMINVLTMSIMIKMGMAPFHMWVPKVMATLSWNMNVILMTWQKLAPLSIINMIEFNYIMYLTITLSTITGAVMGVYQNSLRKIMAYSSISHMGWILTLNKTKDSWITYMLIYSLMIVTLCHYLMNTKVLFISQMIENQVGFTHKMEFIIMMMSLGGMPPFLGFLLKMMAIEEMMLTYSLWMLLVMVLSSMVTLYYYMRVTLKAILLQSLTIKWSIIKNKINYLMLIINIMLPMMVVLY